MTYMQNSRPTVYQEYTESFFQMIANNPFGQLVLDVWVSYKIIISVIPLTFIFCAGYVYLVSEFANAIAYVMLMLVEVVLIGISVNLFYRQSYYTQSNDQNSAVASRGRWLFLYAILAALAAMIYLCLICKWWKNIKEAIRVIDAAADMLRTTKRLMLINVAFFFLQIIIISFWVWGFLGILSMGEIEADKRYP